MGRPCSPHSPRRSLSSASKAGVRALTNSGGDTLPESRLVPCEATTGAWPERSQMEGMVAGDVGTRAEHLPLAPGLASSMWAPSGF